MSQMPARPRQPRYPEGFRLRKADRDHVMGSWTVYHAYLHGQRVGTIHGPDTAGWSVLYGTGDPAADEPIGRGWGGAAATLYDACHKLADAHRMRAAADRPATT